MHMTLFPVWMVLSLGVGFLVGRVYFSWLRQSLQDLSGQAPSYRRFAWKAALRLVFVVAVVAGVLAAGVRAAFVLVGLVGFLAARIVALMENSDKAESPSRDSGQEQQ